MKNYALPFILIICFSISAIGQTILPPTTIYTDPEVDILSNIHSADFDGDGLEDILLSTADINAFWMKNLGGNTFGEPIILYNDEIFGEAVKAGDLDNDGDPDVALACSFSNVILWIENLGDGVFNDAVIVAEGLDPLTDLIIDDFNEDGVQDIMFSTYSATDKAGQIYWLENFSGSFSSKKAISTEVQDSRKIQYADLNGDGRKDVISASYWDYKFVWFENLGQGNFSSEIVIRDELDSVRNHSIYAVDLDKDGDMDIVNGTATLNKNIMWFENDGSAGFTEILIANDGTAWDIAASDLDYDGDVDIFCGFSGDRNAVIYDNLGNNTFSSPLLIAEEVGVIRDIHFVDIDNDFDLDIFTCGALDDLASFFENNGDGTVDVKELQNYNWEVYPNPTAGVFNISVENELVGNQMELYDLQGKKHFQTRIESEAQLITIPKVIAGSYILVIRDQDNKLMSKKSIQVMP